jgi:lipid II isoglutaminyl synthase (glutamine-hydrolysing)
MPDLMTVASQGRLIAAVAGARALSTGLRVSRRGGGTAAPGLLATTIDPAIVRKLTRTLPEGVIIVAGTNGKTTTSRLLAAVLERSGMRVAHNRSGSNLMRGVAAALAEGALLRGRLDADIAVIEADEAAFPEIVRVTSPRLVVLTNLFRDQLDRYGELDNISRRWKPVLERLDQSATVAVNGDDPTLVSMTDELSCERYVFGLDPGMHALERLPHAVDAVTCRKCGAALSYDVLSISHLGAWHCHRCGWRRPLLDAEATSIDLHGIDGLSLTVERGNLPALQLSLTIPGLYNAYNVVAAVAAASVLEIPDRVIAEACTRFVAPFGRVERIPIAGREITFALVKNPVACNEMLRMLSCGDAGISVPTMIAINDLDADGRDVSWLWDVDFETLAVGSAPVFTTGLRGADMANRLKYAGVDDARLQPLAEDLEQALDHFVARLPAEGQGCVLATYTATMTLRRILAKRGLAQSFWEQ